MREYQRNERIVDRAVHLWKQLLANPVYRSTTPDEPEHFKNELVNSFLASRPKNNTPDVLEKFGVELKARLMAPVESKYGAYFENRLDVDYHPCQTLREAGEAAGLKMEWPCKTNMFLGQDYLYFSVGYASPSKYHYPLQDGQWLVTTLHGGKDDVDELIRFANNGGWAGYFTVE